MYGYFRLPLISDREEKKLYRNCMCALCNSLQKYYGVRARIFVNYDCTTLLYITCLINARVMEIVNCQKRIPCLGWNTVSDEILEFICSIIIMLAYCRKYDNQIDSGEEPQMAQWFSNYVEKSSLFLVPYGLSKEFFESNINKQHITEITSQDVDTLSKPSQEILGKIFCGFSKVIEKSKFQGEWESLGNELGSLIYLYDGISDFYGDIEKGNFNCIHEQFNPSNNSLTDLIPEIENIIEIKLQKTKICLEKLEKSYNISSVEKIFLNNPYRNGSFPENYSQKCKISRAHKINGYFQKFQSRLFHILLGGSFFPQIVSASNNRSDPCADCCGGWGEGCSKLMTWCCYGTTESSFQNECNCTDFSCRCCCCCCIPMFICGALCNN